MSCPGSSRVDMRWFVAVLSIRGGKLKGIIPSKRLGARRTIEASGDLAGRLALRRDLSGVGGPVLRPDLVAALEDGAGADGHDGRVHVALDFRLGADEHGAVAGDVTFDLAADDHPAAADLVGDDVALLLDRHDPARADLAAGLVLLELNVFKFERLVAVLARDAQCLAADLEGLAAVQAQDAGRVVGLW